MAGDGFARAIGLAADAAPGGALRASAAELTHRYREGPPAGASAGIDAAGALAYAVTRAPATHAAVHAALSEVATLRPGFAPLRLLDVGAGPGSGLWAAAEVWPTLVEATALEREPAMAELGARLARGAPHPVVAGARWLRADASELSGRLADVVVAGYVLGELEPGNRAGALAAWWGAAAGELVLVEPGTPAGFARLRAARAELIAAGASVTAPCPHDGPCPMPAGDWCHFAVRLARSARHRQAKAAELGFEDEKFAYVALGRTPLFDRPSRLVAAPRLHKGHVRLRLCEPDGLHERVVSRREPAAYKAARAASWGDHLAAD